MSDRDTDARMEAELSLRARVRRLEEEIKELKAAFRQVELDATMKRRADEYTERRAQERR